MEVEPELESAPIVGDEEVAALIEETKQIESPKAEVEDEIAVPAPVEDEAGVEESPVEEEI